MKWNVKVKDQTGNISTVVKEAPDKFALYHSLKEENLTFVSMEAINDGKGFAGLSSKTDLNNIQIPFISGVKMHEKILFAHNLASMLEAGLAISRALSVMDRQTKNIALKKVLNDLSDDIKKGTELSEAMKKHPKVFNNLFISMTAAGEQSGKLADSLGTVASQMEKTYKLQQKIKGAMMYPGIIFTAMIGIGVFMLMYVVPTLTNTFKQLNIKLPATTQFIVSLSDGLQAHSISVLIVVILIGVLLYFGIHTKKGSRFFDWLVLHLPIVAPIIKETNSARTARTFSSLVSSGVSVVDSLSITQDVIQNSYYKEVIEKAKKKIQLGEPISTVFNEASSIYPPFVGEMIAVGEETGELAPMLLKVATYYEDEVDQKTKDMSTVIEPVLMIVIGAAVGFFALSMITPTYSLIDSI